MEKKKVKLFSAIALVALALLVVGVTYAYFQNQYGSASNADVNVTTYTTDVLTFTTGDAINLEADQTTFGKDKGSVSGATYASALLIANNKTNKAVERYYLYLNIENNTFTYSVQDNKPELIMTITDKDGNEVKNIEGLTYTEVTDRTNKKISGYDITTKNGLVTIFKNREIIAEPKAEDKWNITITFVNYEENQNANTGKALSAKLMIQKDEYKILLTDYVKSQFTGVQGENNLYHHDGTLENGINDNSYRYAGASDNVNNYVCFGSNESPCRTDDLYRIIGVFDHKISETQTEQRVKLIKYDYANLLGDDGAYLGEVDDNVYTHSSYLGFNSFLMNYYWYKEYWTNTWSESDLNKINLNTNFIFNIDIGNYSGNAWADKIAETTWKVGGNASDNILEVTPSVAYQNEILNPVTTYTTDGKTEYKAKIGLMYVSDYMYAAPQDKWTLVGYKYDGSNSDNCYGCTMDYRAATSVNWMYMGLTEWTITRDAGGTNIALSVCSSGYGVASDTVDNYSYVVRPTFSLLSSTTYVSGSGTANDPILIN